MAGQAAMTPADMQALEKLVRNLNAYLATRSLQPDGVWITDDAAALRVTLGQVREAEALLRALLAERQWISLDVQLPPKGVGVQITDGKDIWVAEWVGPPKIVYHGAIEHWMPHGWSGYEWDWDVPTGKWTHWAPLLPLPEPPRGGE